MHITEVLYKPFWFYLLVPLLNASILLMCKRSLQASSKYCCSAYLSINGIGQCVNVFVAKPDSLSSVLKPSMVERELTPESDPLTSTRARVSALAHTRAHTHTHVTVTFICLM